MAFQETYDGNTLLWTHEELRIGLTLGHTSFHLDHLDSLCLPTFDELSPFKEEPDREFCAGIQFQPPLDFTVCRLYHSMETSLMTFGLDPGAIKDLHDRLASHLEYRSTPPTPAIIAESLPTLLREQQTHAYAHYLARLLHSPFSNVWAATRYNNFLMMYKGVHPDEALRESFRKYHLPLDSIP